jgi:predicted Zn-dependent protease
LNSGVSSNATTGIGVTDSENSKISERHHEATGSVRLVGKEGDVIWSTTQESNGGKFRSAMADVADKIVRQLADETRKMRDLAAVTRDSRPQAGDPVAVSAKDNAVPGKP